MTPREITTVMHKLFYSHDVHSPDPWRHLMINGELDQNLCESFLRDYFIEGQIIIFVDSQHAVQCGIQNAYQHIRDFMKIRRVKIANPSFSIRAVVDPIGVGHGQAPA